MTMLRPIGLTGAALAAILAVSPVFANGAISERKAGGLVFVKSDTIGIASEELYLSPDLVRVSYRYHSKARAAQDVTISFPMPDVPLDDGPDADDLFYNDKIPDGRNYMNVTVKVDGRAVTTRLIERAVLGGKDVTARLQRDGIPLLLVKDREALLKRIPAKVLQALVDDGFLLRSDSPNSGHSPQWTYQVLIEWKQTFKPGDTKVEVSYRPIIGTPMDYGGYYDTGAGVKKYCIDAAFRAAVQRRAAAGAGFAAYTLGYVLKAARFWNGPIGQFRLIVDKQKPKNLVAFCPADARKVSDTRFEWTRANFVPDADLAVVFFTANE
jgi:hypothetical protein